MFLGDMILGTLDTLEKTILELADLATTNGAVLPPHLVDMVERVKQSQQFASRVEAGEDARSLVDEAYEWSKRQAEKRAEAN